MFDYLPIRVSTLRGDNKITFDAYVHVAGKYILFCREGESFEGERLARLKAKRLTRMYIPEDQALSYNSYVKKSLEQAYDSSAQKTIEVRAQIIHGALQACAEDLIEDPKSQAFYGVAFEGAKRFINFLNSEPNCLDSFLNIKNTDFSVAHHGVTVAALAIAISEELKFNETRPQQMHALAVGCMIHDVEHYYNNINLSVPSEKLTAPEQKLFIKHSTSGFSRLKREPFYDSLVLDIVQNHEEFIDGSGPNKAKEKDLDPLIHVVATANAYDHLITYNQLNPKDALKKLLIDKMGLLSLDSMKALQSALKIRNIV